MDYNQYTDGYITYTQKKNKTLETRFSQSVCLYQSKYCKDTEDYAKKTDYTICEIKLVHLSSFSAKDFFPCQLNTFFSASQRRSPLTAKTFSTASQRLPPLPDKNVHLCQPKTFSSTNQRRSPLLAKDFFHCQPKTTFNRIRASYTALSIVFVHNPMIYEIKNNIAFFKLNLFILALQYN
jgi:hypothetical protein